MWKIRFCVRGGFEFTSLGVVILFYTPRPWLPCMEEHKIYTIKLSFEKLQFWEWKSPLWVREHLVPRPCQYFTFLHAGRPAWRNEKCQHGQGTKCSHINRGLFHSQNCKFPEESFILISFCYSVHVIVQPLSVLIQPLLCPDYLWTTVDDNKKPRTRCKRVKRCWVLGETT